MATHSSILAWRIPWTEEPARLQSMGLQRVGLDWTEAKLDLTCHVSMIASRMQIKVTYLQWPLFSGLLIQFRFREVMGVMSTMYQEC